MNDISTLDFNKSGGLIPVIAQDENTLKVLMLGFVNEEALKVSLESGKLTFFSRTKNRLWTKGETSGNFLNIKSYSIDCDNDTILFKVHPDGPTCHTGADTCFNEENKISETLFIDHLISTIKERKTASPDSSYTASLFAKGINKIAQKVGEEAVEIVIEAKDDNKDLFLGEAADLLFHYLVLIEAKNYSLDEVIEVLKKRHLKK